MVYPSYHTTIGILYPVATFLFFLLGSVEALMMRLQLGRGPEHDHGRLDLQRARLVARLDDGLPDARPGLGRLRQLPRSAHDRGARPFPRLNALSFLAAAVRRDRLLRQPVLLTPRGRLDLLRAALGRCLPPRRRDRRVDPDDPPHRPLLDPRRAKRQHENGLRSEPSPHQRSKPSRTTAAAEARPRNHASARDR